MPIVIGNTAVVASGGVSLTVSGLFSLPYQIAPSANWATEIKISQKTSTSFFVDFTTPAPLDGSGLFDYIVSTPQVSESSGVGLTAGEIIMNVRDEIPDPVDDADQDGGLFKARTLYGWLDDGVRIMARVCGSIVDDWTAIPQVNRQPWYSVSPLFQMLDEGFSNQWRLNLTQLTQGDVIWPSTSQAQGQALWAYLRKRTDHMEVGLYLVPNATDPVTPLVTPLGITGDPAVVLTDSTNFLSFGYVQIDSEIIQYQQVDGSNLQVLSRGVCGTTATTHLAGAAVQSLGLWLHGTRNPQRITSSCSAVELPLDVVSDVKTYLLARCRGAENEYEERSRLMREFDAACKAIRADPSRKENSGQIRAFGENAAGPLYKGVGFGLILPALVLCFLGSLGSVLGL